MNKIVLADGKYLINHHDLVGLDHLYQDIKTPDAEYRLNYSYIFQKLFIHACATESKEIIIYLIQMYFEIFNSVTQIALRQSFFYGKYMIKRDDDLVDWYSDHIIPLIKHLE